MRESVAAMARSMEMNLRPEERQAIVEATHKALLERAAHGTLDTADPLRQLTELDSAWRDPDAGWALASSLLKLTERRHRAAGPSARSRAQLRLVESVTLAVYDQVRLRHLRGADVPAGLSKS
jgi:hypothetical protein